MRSGLTALSGKDAPKRVVVYRRGEDAETELPVAGLYSFEIYFSARNGGEALKGEYPFTVLSREE